MSKATEPRNVQPVGEGKKLDAFSAVVNALAPLSDEQRVRVMQAAAALLDVRLP